MGKSKKRKGRGSDEDEDDLDGFDDDAPTTDASEEEQLAQMLASDKGDDDDDDDEEEGDARDKKRSKSSKHKSKHKKHKKEKHKKDKSKHKERSRDTPSRTTRSKRARYTEPEYDWDKSSESGSSGSEAEATTKATAQHRRRTSHTGDGGGSAGGAGTAGGAAGGGVAGGDGVKAHASFRPAHRSRKKKGHSGSGAGDEEMAVPELDSEVLPFTSKHKDEAQHVSSSEGGEQGEEEDSDMDPDQEWESTCSVCKKDTDVKVLLCCETCPRVYHLYCLTPALSKVPKGDWHCPHCALLIEFEKMERILDVRTVPVHHPENEPLLKALAHSKEQLHARSRKKQVKGVQQQAGGTAAEGGTAGGDTRKEYLLKFKGMSYIHCRWVSEKRLMRAVRMVLVIKQKWSRYVKQMHEGSLGGTRGEEEEDDATRDYVWNVNPQWLVVERVVAKKFGPLSPAPGLTPMGAGSATPPPSRDCTQYLIKWQELGYEHCTWEDERVLDGYKAELAAFEARQPIGEVALQARLARAQARRQQSDQVEEATKADGVGSGTRKFLTTPTWLHGGELHPYQLEGLNWLFHKWQSRQNVILADEMGLGKTVQAISLLAALEAEEHLGRPHLVVVPLSTVRNWERELSTWAPQLNVVTLVGNAEARKVILDYELYTPLPAGHQREKSSPTTRVKFHVLLTSYELLISEASVLQRAADWGVLLVDEGHRLKSKTSRLFQDLHAFKSHFRLLLTGTPLQNNLGELFMLLHFLEPRKFNDQHDFEEQFSDLSGEAQVTMLHEQLAPHLLRRMKRDVLKKLPPKQEQVVRVELSALQKQFYKSLLERHYPVLSGAVGGGKAAANTSAMKNLMMELRKCCNHPYLFDGADPALADPAAALTHLIESSGKLALLDRMLPKLLAKGHRVLLYSQFTRVLDIIEDWLDARSHTYLRIDGTIPGAERQRRIDLFNRNPEQYPLFLLSTRAGGVGINLTPADTVIIYDSDWNPHNDLQAQARAHRLGQTRPVMIYRLVTRATIEERMMQVSRKKLLLEHLVVRKLGQSGGGKQQALKQSELDDMLRYGAKELFAEDEEAVAAAAAADGAGGSGGAGGDGATKGDARGTANGGTGSEADQQAADGNGAGGSAAAGGAASAARPSKKMIVYDDAALDMLLDRSELLAKGEQEVEEEEDLFKAFKVANFNMVVDEPSREPAATEPTAPAAAPGAAPGAGGISGSSDAVPDTDAIIKQVCPEQDEPGGATFWDSLIGHKYVAHRHEELAGSGRGRRERGNVKYTEDFPELSSSSGSDKDSDEFKATEEEEDSEEEEVEADGSDEDAQELRRIEQRMRNSAARSRRRQGLRESPGPRGGRGGGRGGKRVKLESPARDQAKAAAAQQGRAAGAALPPLMTGAGDHLKVLGFNAVERGLFLITFMSFGLPTGGEVNGLSAALSQNPEDLGSNRVALERVYEPYMQRLPGKPLAHVMAYCQLLIRSCCQPGAESDDNFPSGVPKASMIGSHNPSDVVARMGHMHMIRIKIASSEAARQFSLSSGPLAPTIKCTSHWARKHDFLLLRGTQIHGFGHYKRILEDPSLGLKKPLLGEVGMLPPGQQPAQGQGQAGSSRPSGDGSAGAGGEGGEAGGGQGANKVVVKQEQPEQQEAAPQPYDDEVFHTRAAAWLTARMAALLNVLDYELQQTNEAAAGTNDQQPPGDVAEDTGAAAAAAEPETQADPTTAAAGTPPPSATGAGAAPDAAQPPGNVSGGGDAVAKAAAAVSLLTNLPVLTPTQLAVMPPAQRIQYLELLKQQQRHKELVAAMAAGQINPEQAAGAAAGAAQAAAGAAAPAASPPPQSDLPALPEAQGKLEPINIASLSLNRMTIEGAGKQVLAEQYNKIVNKVIAVREETIAASNTLDTHDPLAMQRAARSFRQQLDVAARDIKDLIANLPTSGTLHDMLKQRAAQLAAQEAAKKARDKAIAEENRRAAIQSQRQQLVNAITLAAGKVANLTVLIEARKKELLHYSQLALDAEHQHKAAQQALALFEQQLAGTNGDGGGGGAGTAGGGGGAGAGGAGGGGNTGVHKAGGSITPPPGASVSPSVVTSGQQVPSQAKRASSGGVPLDPSQVSAAVAAARGAAPITEGLNQILAAAIAATVQRRVAAAAAKASTAGASGSGPAAAGSSGGAAGSGSGGGAANGVGGVGSGAAGSVSAGGAVAGGQHQAQARRVSGEATTAQPVGEAGQDQGAAAATAPMAVDEPPPPAPQQQQQQQMEVEVPAAAVVSDVPMEPVVALGSPAAEEAEQAQEGGGGGGGGGGGAAADPGGVVQQPGEQGAAQAAGGAAAAQDAPPRVRPPIDVVVIDDDD